MLTEGAQVKRVDHPGSPGVESVIAGGPADGRASETAVPTADGPVQLWGGGETAELGAALQPPPKLELSPLLLKRLSRRTEGRLRRSSRHRSRSSRGRTIGAAPMIGRPRDVAWEATLRAVARDQPARTRSGNLAFTVAADELLMRRRARPPDHLLMLVVDASGSMASQLTAVARTVAERALRHAYVDRQQVAMIAFRARGAEVLFGPTARVERARRALDRLPLGGATPLGRGLDLAHAVLRRSALQRDYGHCTVLIISDGDTNVGNRNGYGSAHQDVEQACRKLIALPETEFVLLDTTGAGADERPARWVARLLGARHVRLCDS